MPAAISFKFPVVHLWLPCGATLIHPSGLFAVDVVNSRGRAARIGPIPAEDLKEIDGTPTVRALWVTGPKGGPHLVEFRSGQAGIFNRVLKVEFGDQGANETAALPSDC